MIHLLTKFDITEDEGMSVIVLLRSDSKRKEMITYLKMNPGATPMEIVEKAVEIREK
jgi:hypothetical protein